MRNRLTHFFSLLLKNDSKKNGVYNADVCIVMIKWRQAKKIKDGGALEREFFMMM